MKIKEILNKNKFTISVEFFPPKTEEGEKELILNVRNLEIMQPDFVAVTYGAGGTSRERTKNLSNIISKEEKQNVMAHLTCIGHTKSEIIDILSGYKKSGIENIMALRGDTPVGTDLKPENGELPHTIDLIKLIKENFGDYFSIGGAAFPELHPESPNMEWEMKYFKEKAEAGMEFATTQLFFDNSAYYRYMEQVIKAGIQIPILPGIMPITNFKQIKKMLSMTNAIIPQILVEKLEKNEDNIEEMAKIGIDFAIGQCQDLIKNGVKGLHFYTMNKSNATLKIFEAVKHNIK